MAFIDVHPEYRSLLAQLGLATVGDVLALPALVCCGHPDRNVARVSLGKGSEAVPCFLKREHCIRWRDRLANAWAGFGFGSRSRREFAMLRTVEAAGIGGPQAIATGEADDGRAFLLLRELEGYQDLRLALLQARGSFAGSTRSGHGARFARQLGTALARMHEAGFEHPDLSSKHVLVKPAPSPADGNAQATFRFLDWQRVTRRRRVPWTTRWRDLAALDATLADDLASPRQRLVALHAYLRACRVGGKVPALRTAAREIRHRARRLLRRRRILEMRQPPLALGVQNLIWLDGQALQVTREFRDEIGGEIPPWLKKGTQLFSTGTQVVPLPGSRQAHLSTRSASRPLKWLWSKLWRRPVVAPEVETMNVLFRLERYGVVLPRLLAAGQKHPKPWQMQSFLLTEPVQKAVPLPEFLRAADPKTRRLVLRQAARVLRQMHQATCYVQNGHHDRVRNLLTVSPGADGPVVALTTIHTIEKSTDPNPVRAWRDLAALVQAIAGIASRTDLLRGLLEYANRPRLTPPVRQFARRILARLPGPLRRRRIAA